MVVSTHESKRETRQNGNQQLSDAAVQTAMFGRPCSSRRTQWAERGERDSNRFGQYYVGWLEDAANRFIEFVAFLLKSHIVTQYAAIYTYNDKMCMAAGYTYNNVCNQTSSIADPNLMLAQMPVSSRSAPNHNGDTDWLIGNVYANV